MYVIFKGEILDMMSTKALWGKRCLNKRSRNLKRYVLTHKSFIVLPFSFFFVVSFLMLTLK